MQPLQETLALLEGAARSHKRIVVAYSGGKDSIATLDMCIKTFGKENVDCFFMYLIPGMECVERELDRARQRWGVRIRQYPHWILHKLLTNGAYGTAWFQRDDIQLFEWKLQSIYAVAMADSGATIIGHGAKKSDSRWRKKQLGTWGKQDYMLYPLIGWRKPDVLAYLQINKLWVPDSSGTNATGIDLTPPSLLWLHDNHPNDFAKLAVPFPYIWAVVYRRKFYGVSA